MSAAVRGWRELTFTARRWQHWPEWLPFGTQTTTWRKFTTAERACAMAARLLEEGALAASVRSVGDPDA